MTAILEALEIWKLHAILREGRKNVVYLDNLGYETGGIGHLLTAEDKKKYHLGSVISDIQIDIWFEQDTEKALKKALKQWKEINILTPRFLAALISVNFQLGDFSVKFKNSYQLLKQRKFDQVIANLKSSLWARQTPVRVKDFIAAIEELKGK